MKRHRMRGVELNITVELVTETCCNCGMLFAMSADFQQRRREYRGWFYCPSGHAQYYTGKTVAEKAQEQAARYKRLWDEATREAADERQRRGDVERQLRATKAAHTRTKKRVANGVCPCCNRTFQNLARHMAGKHPDYEEA
jgi:hypothetical protein